ncbi:sirohydrochlorin chelatase [Bacillus piscicola]|uniref:sirohydrochlorin chelatase n=1 Tax=Bacillus piscicola TaxID=1632684 RepID=UPI001F09EBA2|nr:sirohydrochlorin chelatase [Bacillus piscicola]
MKAVLFIGHGSPKEEGNTEISNFVNELKKEMNESIIETCFLEFANPTIAEGVHTCVQKGATHVALVPIMFLPAGHSKIHIPHAIDEAKEKYPDVSFTYGRPIGIHQEMVNLLQEKLEQEAGLSADQQEKDTAILIVGRGSSDADTNSEVYKLSRLLSEALDHTLVEVCFIGVTKPDVESGVDRCLRLGMKNVILLPYFFFSGILMDRTEAKVAEFQKEYPERKFSSTSPIGFHPRLKTILKERAAEALEGEASLNCDMCQYRLFAVENMDGIHHHHHEHDHDHGHHHSHSS